MTRSTLWFNGGIPQLATLLLAIFHLEREPNRATVPVHEEPP